MIRYHDEEWGKPVYEDQKLFEMLVLEGMQAGLSWATVLKKRQAYRDAFFHFDLAKVAHMQDQDLQVHLGNSDLIRNRLKIFSVRQNARVFLALQKQHGSFARYAWSYVGDVPQVNTWASASEIPHETEMSFHFSKDLKKEGMQFVGPTIIYAFMQAVGMVNNHEASCWLRTNKLKCDGV